MKKPGDVYIIHGSGIASADRAWWLHTVLEFADLRTSGSHLNWPKHHGLPEPTLHTYEDNPERTLEVQDCRTIILMLDKRSSDFDYVRRELGPVKDQMIK